MIRDRTFGTSIILSALCSIVVGCGWPWSEYRSYTPEKTLSVAVYPDQVDRFIHIFFSLAEEQELGEPIVRELVMYGNFDIHIENNEIMIRSNDVMKKDVFDVSFYCKIDDCGSKIEQVSGAFLKKIEEDFDLIETSKKQD